MDKKSISPLIATVLMIVFTVSLAITVTTWGRQLIMGTAKDVEQQTFVDIICGLDVRIDVVDVTGERQLCYDETSDNLKITIENGPDKEIIGLQVVIISEDSVVSQLVEENFARADIKKVSVNYDGLTPIQGVRLMPQIQGFQFCLDAQITEELIPGCD